jgi:hypothetical protein
MALTSFKVADFDEVIFVSVAPKTDQDGEQRTNYEGALLFLVNVGVFEEKRGRIVQESFDITVPAGPDGKTGLEMVRRGTPVKVDKLTARPWNMDTGNGIAFSADRVVVLAAAPPAAKAS